MITGKDVRLEIRETGKVIESEANVGDKIKAVYKLLTVALKLDLSIRTSLVKVMEKLGVEKVKPRTTEDAPKEETTDDSIT